MSNPQIAFDNELGDDVQLFDSFTSDDEPNYYGKLTPLGTVKAGSSATITGLHSAVNVVIAFDGGGHPVGRYAAMFSKKAFSITAGDVAAVAEGTRLVDLRVAHPDDPVAVQFAELLQESKTSDGVKKIDDFLAQTTDYAHCTYADYMLALTDRARHPASPPQPEARVYKLSMLCNLLGGTWPDGFPDIAVRDFKCSTRNDTLFLGALVEVVDLPFEDSSVAKNVLSVLPAHEVDAEFSFSYEPGLNLFRTTISFTADDFHIPVGNGATVTLKSPKVSFDISPLFKFVVFKAQAQIPFDIFGEQFDASIIMVIDNIEAQISVEISGEHGSLPAPPPMKGVHFDDFAVGMGIIFEPPAYALGLEGRFHIGEGDALVTLNDDTFALICGFEGDVPNPLYISFYVPALDLSTLVEVFTDTHLPLDVPVQLEQLSFQWAENPMEPLVLPDGSLTEMAFGCNAYLRILGLQLYGSLRIDLGGIEGLFEMAPVALGDLLHVSGDGKGVNLKVDEQGNPLRNNIVPKTKADHDAIANAPLKEFVSPGGPELTISTSTSPYFSLDAAVSLFELVDYRVDARIDNSGISFTLDYGSVLRESMACVLRDFHNFSADFVYGIDVDIPLPTVDGYSLGHLPIEALCNAGLEIDTSSSEVRLEVHGSFDVEGITVTFGPFGAAVDISRLTDLLAAIETYLVDHAEELFSVFIDDAGRWASYVKNEVIAGVTDVAQGLQSAFNASEGEAATIMNQAGYDIDEAAAQIKNAYNTTAATLAGALSEGYAATGAAAAVALHAVGYGATECAQALSTVFGMVPDGINAALQGVGYAADQVKGAFEELGGDFADFASDAWGEVEENMDPTNW